MPTDRTNTNNPGRPLKPTLATTRTAKTPIAPRLAISASSASGLQTGRTPRVAATTPKAPIIPPDDRTPVKSLNNNITPRSSARRSRIGLGSPTSTASATPSGTPSNSRPSSTIDVATKEQGYPYSGLGTNGLQSAQSSSRPRSVVGGSNYNTTPTPRPHVANIYNNPAAADAGGARAKSPKFFHADDARDARGQDAAPPAKRGPVFFYANGQQGENARTPGIPSPPLSALGRPQQENKFFHADSRSEPRGTSPVLTPPPASATLEPWAGGNLGLKPPVLRSTSPPKDSIHLSYRKGASQVIRPNLHNRSSALSVISGNRETDSEQDNSRRRSSVVSAVRLGHGKSASLSSIDSVTSLKKAPSQDVLPHTPSPLHTQKRVVSSSSLSECVASPSGPANELLSGLPSPNPHSPIRTNGTLEQMNELASNARRERKVLDLEISNSSLLAINRQLEREVRKQKAELRRFRRLSRAGRFSAESNQDTFPTIGASEMEYLTDMSEEEEAAITGLYEEEEPEYSSESSFDENIMSPTALAEKDAEYRLRDEKRLQLDLTKHRELLVDSQKMNQSLKRCLDWTEELIKDGRKALAYQVRPSDVKLGGRVLNTEDTHALDAEEESKGLLSPWSPAHEIADVFGRTSLSGSERTDRDSGVDVDGLKPNESDLPSNISLLGSPLSKVPPQLPGTSGFTEETY